MKDKIIIFLIGLLLGSIISTGSIYVYTIANNNNNPRMGEPPSGEMGQNNFMNNGEQPPERPEDSRNENSSNNQ